MLQLLRAELPIPILGVCLGMQALALAHGGAVEHAPEPVHGRLSGVRHRGHPLFAGIPSGPAYPVVRYHSLLVREEALPACLEPIAWTCGGHHALELHAGSSSASSSGGDNDAGRTPAGAAADGSSSSGGSSDGSSGSGLLMALAHRSLPHYGVQFHPESVATGYGAALLANFAALTAAHHGLPPLNLPPAMLARLPGAAAVG